MIGQGGASALVAAVLTFGLATLISPNHSGPQAINAVLTSGSTCGGPNFCITSPNPGPVLYPRATPSNLTVTFQNPLAVGIQVSSLQVSFTNAFPSGANGCDPTALQVGGRAVTGTPPAVTLSLSPYVNVGPGASTTYSTTLALVDNHANQDGCENLKLALGYQATAYYSSACANGTLVTQTVNGGLTVQPGEAVCIDNARVNGNVTVDGTGQLYTTGATINGSITANGAGALGICGTSVNGGITSNGATGFVVIGDGGDDGPPGCAANTIKGGVSLTGGTTGFEVAGNTISGGAAFSSNTGAPPSSEDSTAPEVEGNTITGTLSCATSNVPAITDDHHTNAVSGSKTGECAGATF